MPGRTSRFHPYDLKDYQGYRLCESYCDWDETPATLLCCFSPECPQTHIYDSCTDSRTPGSTSFQLPSFAEFLHGVWPDYYPFISGTDEGREHEQNMHEDEFIEYPSLDLHAGDDPGPILSNAITPWPQKMTTFMESNERHEVVCTAPTSSGSGCWERHGPAEVNKPGTSTKESNRGSPLVVPVSRTSGTNIARSSRRVARSTVRGARKQIKKNALILPHDTEKMEENQYEFMKRDAKNRAIWKCLWKDPLTELPCEYRALKSSVKRHYQGVHLNCRPAECPFCGQRFRAASPLKIHIYTVHTGEKRFACKFENCEERFSDPSRLTGHYDSAHNGEGKQKRDKNAYAGKFKG